MSGTADRMEQSGGKVMDSIPHESMKQGTLVVAKQLGIGSEASLNKDSVIQLLDSSGGKLTIKDVKNEVARDLDKRAVVNEFKPSTNGVAEPKTDDGAEESTLPLEADSVAIQPHWHARPCVHITGLGGLLAEEDLVPYLSPHGRIVSIVFENERRDSVIVRYEPSGSEGDDVVARVRDALNNSDMKDRNLVIEPFRPDSLLFIGNLTPEIDDVLLRQMFEPHGTVERSFVLKNAEGRSKGYGFVEYSLKSQASAAKVAMGNINMDGRVLRVEWSDCRKISDMFSTVLFVDRIAKDCPHIENSLRNIFGLYGRVRDCHLAIGMNQQFRGFAFIDFYHSTFADKAHQVLDGREVEGSNIRVSFANPSKSAQSYKSRFGSQALQPTGGLPGRGGFTGMRGQMPMPLLGSRFIAPGRSNMLGMSIGMQFGRGAPVGPGMIGRSLVPPLLGSGAGMLGPGSVAAGMMGRGPGLILGNVAPRAGIPGSYGQPGARIPSGRGPVPISSAAIAQVATAQAKAREEEAKARAEAQAKQSQSGAKLSAAEQERLEQFRKMAAQITPQPVQNYYQQQSQANSHEQQYKQPDPQYSYQTYQQPAPQQQSAAIHSQYQQPVPTGQLAQQSYNPQYYSQSTQQYAQQTQAHSQSQPQVQVQVQAQAQAQAQATATQTQPQQQTQQQYSQLQAYYQPPAQPAATQATTTTQQQYTQYAQQYSQQYAQPFAQQQQYAQQYAQPTQQYTQTAQPQLQYTQQDYADYYAQQQQDQQAQGQVAAVATVATVTAAAPAAATVSVQAQTQDASQQAYAAYYQQRAQQAVAQAGSVANQATAIATGAQQSLEAQWAAYYAAQAAHQQATAASGYDQQQGAYLQQQPYTANATAYYQQPAVLDVGQKRTSDQIDYSSQTQNVQNYGYQQQPSAATTGYTQQASNGTTAYQQQPTSVVPTYQQPPTAVQAYQQQVPAVQVYSGGVAAATYQQPTPTSGYQQPATAVASGYQQQPAAPTTAYSQQTQAAATAPVYDYSKRPRY